MSDATAPNQDRFIWYATGLGLILLAAAFSLGMSYQKGKQSFTYHEIPLKSGGIAFVVPEKWQVVTEWDKYGRPYIKPSDQKPTKKGEKQ